MNKIYHLSSCSTCQRIIKELNHEDQFEYQNIKEINISATEIDRLKAKVGSYEALFSKRAMKFRSLGLNQMKLNEGEYRDWMLREYTFLKRPFILIGDEAFIGNTKGTVAAAKSALEKQQL